MKCAFSALAAISAITAYPAYAEDDIRVVTVDARVVVLADLAVLPKTVAARHGARPVVKLAKNSEFLELTEQRRKQLVRRELPALSIALRHDGTIRFRSALPAQRSAPSRPCYALSRPVESGEFIERADVDRIDCRDKAAITSVRYIADANMLAATERLETGWYLGTIRIPQDGAVPAGASLKLVSRQGPVSVTREVTALQPARAGGRIFVRTKAGEVISAPLSTSKDQQP